MQRFYWVLAVGGFSALTALSVGCAHDTVPKVEDQIVGRWEWVRSTNGTGAGAITPTTTGHTNVIEFDRRGRARFYRDGSMLGATTFTIRRGVGYKNNHGQTLIIYQGYNNEQICSISGDRLFLQDADKAKGSHVFFKASGRAKSAATSAR